MDISTLFGVVRRRWLLIVLCVAVAAGAAYAFSRSQDPIYSASTQILLRGGTEQGSSAGASPTGSEFGAPLPTTAADREALVLSGPILARVERRLRERVGAARAAAGVRGVTATVGAESDVVTIDATAPDPKLAALVANTVATENLAYRRETAVAKIRRALRTAERQLADFGGGEVEQRAVALQQLEQRVAALRQAASLQTGDAEVIRRASPPSSPTSPKPGRDALIGGFAGLLLGIGIALVREQLDRRLRHPKELESAIGLPVLADVPRSRALATGNGVPAELPAPEAEAFQMLRANLHYVNAERELRSVLVTSAGVGDGKSTVALHLAKADASAGTRVLLMDADVRRPRIAGLLGLPDGDGLSSLLSSRQRKLTDAVHRIPVGQRTNGASSGPLTLDVLTAGPKPPNPSELIDSERMRALIREAEQQYDLIIIDCSPVAIVSDPIPLMREVSAVIVVGRVGATTSGQASDLRKQLERVDAPAFGIVANFAGRPAGYYGYDS